jgi:hypothetical protein
VEKHVELSSTMDILDRIDVLLYVHSLGACHEPLTGGHELREELAR